ERAISIESSSSDCFGFSRSSFALVLVSFCESDFVSQIELRERINFNFVLTSLRSRRCLGSNHDTLELMALRIGAGANIQNISHYNQSVCDTIRLVVRIGWRENVSIESSDDFNRSGVSQCDRPYLPLPNTL